MHACIYHIGADRLAPINNLEQLPIIFAAVSAVASLMHEGWDEEHGGGPRGQNIKLA
jgi:hypothetical protein